MVTDRCVGGCTAPSEFAAIGVRRHRSSPPSEFAAIGDSSLSGGSPTLRAMTETLPAMTAAKPRRLALSPSRAADFKQCPLLYRFRAVDRLPETPSRAQVKGTVVHAALETLFGLPAAERVPARAVDLVLPSWERLLAEAPDLIDLVPGD